MSIINLKSINFFPVLLCIHWLHSSGKGRHSNHFEVRFRSTAADGIIIWSSKDTVRTSNSVSTPDAGNSGNGDWLAVVVVDRKLQLSFRLSGGDQEVVTIRSQVSSPGIFNKLDYYMIIESTLLIITFSFSIVISVDFFFKIRIIIYQLLKLLYQHWKTQCCNC